MALGAGDKLGPYEIAGHLGKGGMGEVYRATDPRLHRDVAIKISAEKFSDRFEKEAHAVAALNHPNICTLHDIGPNYLVMELVEGETLAERIRRGAIPLEEALAMARQIAGALEAAHEKGVTHRDLKPANIKITPEGTVKVLDFGLAIMAGPESAPGSDPEHSPTLTLEAATRLGAVMGTAGYMAPEQAKGKKVDKRADIWAFGVVLYEMVTGRRLFQGEDLTEILASVVKEQPDLSTAPREVRRLLSRCLEKNPKKRLRDIGDVWDLLDGEPAESRPQVETRSAKAWLWPAVAVVAIVIAAVAGWVAWRAPRPVERPLKRFSDDLGPEAVRAPVVSVVLSPDGTRIVFVGKAAGGSTPLYTRRLDQPNATLLARSDDSSPQPFFSPGGEWIGFNGGDAVVKKVSAQGGSAVPLGKIPPGGFYGASWGDDGNIIVGSRAGLWRIPGTGGATKFLKQGAGVQVLPQVLPGAKAVLFNGPPKGQVQSLDDLDIDAVQLDTGRQKTLLHGGYWPRYLATPGETGYLIYAHEGTLFGVGFDPRRLELLGTPTPLLDDLAASPDLTTGGGEFAVSNTGTLVYLSGHALGASYPLLWLDAAGKTTPLVAQPGIYGVPRLSPDGKRLAYIARGGNGSDAWVYDLERAAPAQVTFLGSVHLELAWARDSKHLVYSDGKALWWIRADGSGQPQPLLEKVPTAPRPSSFAPDGRLAFSRVNENGGLPDIYTLPIDLSDPEHPKPGKAEPFLTVRGRVEVDPAFSPDGKFMAYASNQEGEEQVFVRPFSGPGGEWKVSTGGGKFPAWSGATHELFFLGGDDGIMASSYSIQGDSFRAGVPRAWSPTQVRRTTVLQDFDVSPDGKRVVMMPRPRSEHAGSSLHATFLLNFFDEVRRLVPLNGR